MDMTYLLLYECTPTGHVLRMRNAYRLYLCWYPPLPLVGQVSVITILYCACVSAVPVLISSTPSGRPGPGYCCHPAAPRWRGTLWRPPRPPRWGSRSPRPTRARFAAPSGRPASSIPVHVTRLTTFQIYETIQTNNCLLLKDSETCFCIEKNSTEPRGWLFSSTPPVTIIPSSSSSLHHKDNIKCRLCLKCTEGLKCRLCPSKKIPPDGGTGVIFACNFEGLRLYLPVPRLHIQRLHCTQHLTRHLPWKSCFAVVVFLQKNPLVLMTYLL